MNKSGLSTDYLKWHDECEEAPCARCRSGCEISLAFIKDGPYDLVPAAKERLTIYLETLIKAGIQREATKSKCGCVSIGKKPNPDCFSAACEFCQFCGACNATIKYEKMRFCDAECEQAWKNDEPNA